MDLYGLILSAVPVLLGIGIVSTYVIKIANLLKQAADVLTAISKAVEDNNVTKEEIGLIISESKEVVEAIKAFGKK